MSFQGEEKQTSSVFSEGRSETERNFGLAQEANFYQIDNLIVEGIAFLNASQQAISPFKSSRTSGQRIDQPLIDFTNSISKLIKLNI